MVHDRHTRLITALVLIILPARLNAQEHQIIEGDLLAKRKDKNLDGKGMKLPDNQQTTQSVSHNPLYNK